MFCGSLSNTYVAGRPLARLTIGVTNSDGERAELLFVRDDATTDLVANIPEDYIPLPGDDELNAQYLTKMDWTCSHVHGLGQMWSDPIGGGDYTFQNALDMQAARDHRDMVNDLLSFEDTPLALEVYGGE